MPKNVLRLKFTSTNGCSEGLALNDEIHRENRSETYLTLPNGV
jgi:hypothetical protein